MMEMPDGTRRRGAAAAVKARVKACLLAAVRGRKLVKDM